MIGSDESIVGRKIERKVVDDIWAATEAYKASLKQGIPASVREATYENLRRITYESKIYGEKPEDFLGPDFLENFNNYHDAYVVRSRVYEIINALMYSRIPKEKVFPVLQAIGVEVV